MSREDLFIDRPNTPPEPPVLGGDALQSMLDRVRAETLDEPQTPFEGIRSLPTAARVTVLVSIQVMVGALAIGLQTVRDDILSVVAQLSVLVVVAVFSAALSLRPMGQSDGHVARWWPWAAALPALVSIPALWPGVSMGFWEAMPQHMTCLWRTLAVAALCTVPYLALERHDMTRRWTLVTAAGSAGLVAFVVQVSTCPLATLEHRVIAHGASGLVIAAVLLVIGAVFGQRR